MKKLLFITGISLLTCCMAAGEKEAARVRNIVLVHGAWGRWLWMESRPRHSR